jgi:hypothetical protein
MVNSPNNYSLSLHDLMVHIPEAFRLVLVLHQIRSNTVSAAAVEATVATTAARGKTLSVC